jgi:hypothetical protein
MDYESINWDKHMYAVSELPLITVYDDNYFLRNDYDVLSIGQRNYLINFFAKSGFIQKTGKRLTKDEVNIHLPRPHHQLAQSSFDEIYLHNDGENFYCVTPTQFAEVLFYRDPNEACLSDVKKLIEKCPFNIEWLRDISYRSKIETITKNSYSELMAFQKEVIERKFKYKKAL